MKDGKTAFRSGDRLRMVDCKDPYAPIMSGTKGTVVCVDALGTAHMSWDDGRTLGVIPEEDVVERIPLDEEYDRLRLASVSERDEDALEADRERSLEAIRLMESAAFDEKGAWAVRITFLDPARRREAAEYAFVEADGLGALIDGADAKNGFEVGFHRAGRHLSFVMIAHGAGYDLPKGASHMQEAFECRLLKREVAEDFRERMENARWGECGEGAEKMFFSPGDQTSLALEECWKTLEQHRGGERDSSC